MYSADIIEDLQEKYIELYAGFNSFSEELGGRKEECVCL